MTTNVLPSIGPSMADRRRALVAVCTGNAMEWYDFALFAGSATVMAAVLTPGGWAGFTAVFAVFAMSCLFRPLGSLVVGLRADRSGRRSTLAATILLMAGATAAIGLLPSWAVIGVAAPLGLLALRAVQAFSAGGEIGVSVAYLTEFSAPGRRASYTGWYLSTVAIGFATGLGATAVMAALLAPQELQAWGWRIPFLLAIPLGAVGLYLRRRLAESPEFVHTQSTSSTDVLTPATVTPATVIPATVTGAHDVPAATQDRVRPMTVLAEHRPTVRRGFVIAGAYSAAFNIWFLFLPSYVTATGASSLANSLTCALIGLLAVAVGAPLFGRLSDRVGRRPLLIAGAAALVVVVVPLYLWMLGGSSTALLVGSVTVGVIISAFVLPAFFAEQFPSRVRATGLGLAYGIGSAVIGGTAPLLATALSRQVAPVVVPCYLALLAIGAVVAVIRSPETLPTARRPIGDADGPGVATGRV